jgi:hypothetical protein
MEYIVDNYNLRIYNNNVTEQKVIENYDFLKILEKYVDINYIYNILNSLDNQILKNIYNYIIIKWNCITKNMTIKSEFKTQRYLTTSDLNRLLRLFINDELYKAIFVINSISLYLVH